MCCSQALFYKLSQLECLLLRTSVKKNRESSDITHDGDKGETYLDAYKKWDNQCIVD